MLWTTSVCWSVLLLVVVVVVVASLCGHSIASNQTSENPFGEEDETQVTNGEDIPEEPFPFMAALEINGSIASNQTSEDSFDEEGVTTIINGQAIPDGRFPFIAALVTDLNTFCGASIISRRYLLTAAHCVRDPNDNPIGASKFRVGVGSANQKQMSWHQVAQVRTHRDYRYRILSLGNDIALVKLSEPLRLERGRVETIALAPQGAPVPGKLGLIGWGITANGNENVVDQLRGVDVRVIDLSECARVTGLRYTDKVFCDWGNYRSSCSGDSGSPLFNIVNGQFVQHGIVSGGIHDKCGDLPGFYTKVSAYSRLINNLIKQ